jgi:hypothetical protein
LDVVGGSARVTNPSGTTQIQVSGSASSGRLGQDSGGFFFASDTNGPSLRFLTNNGTLHEWMRITSAGNVGIGTLTPAARLDVAGNANVSGSVTLNGNLNLPPTTGSNVGVITLGGNPMIHACCGSSSIFIGNGAGGNFSNTGTYNTATGLEDLHYNTSGSYNTANGASALVGNTTGSDNTAVGYAALGIGSTGSNNTATGSHALGQNTGEGNTANGYLTLYINTTGSNN